MFRHANGCDMHRSWQRRRGKDYSETRKCTKLGRAEVYYSPLCGARLGGVELRLNLDCTRLNDKRQTVGGASK